MSRSVRLWVRSIHLLSAALLGTFVYSPWSADPMFATSVRWFAFPVLAASGLFLWRGHLFLRVMRNVS